MAETMCKSLVVFKGIIPGREHCITLLIIFVHNSAEQHKLEEELTSLKAKLEKERETQKVSQFHGIR